MEKDLEKRIKRNIVPTEVSLIELQALADVKDFFAAEDDSFHGKCLEKPGLYKLVKVYQTAYAYREEKARE